MSASSCPMTHSTTPSNAILTTDTLQWRQAKRMLNQYSIVRVLGRGMHGTVVAAVKDPQVAPVGVSRVAIKVLRRNPPPEGPKRLQPRPLPKTDHIGMGDRMGTAETKIRKEIAIMKKLDHPNVVRLYEVIDDPLKTKIYMVMERLRGGEVMWTRNDRPILTVEQVRRIMRDVILGIQYLHYQGIIHRDIKPGNLLYSDDRRQVKIADFGVAHFSHALRLEAAGSDSFQNMDPILLDDTELSKRAGTPPFLAPEVVYEYAEHSTNGRPAITKAIDIWALGVTLYALLFGKLPFVPDPGKDSIYNTWHKIANCDWDVDSIAGSDRMETGGRHPPADCTDLGPMLVRLLDHFLQKDVRKRITLDEVKNNPWFVNELPEPAVWRELCDQHVIDVIEQETSDAVTTVQFRWGWSNLARRISTMFRRRNRRRHQTLASNLVQASSSRAAPSAPLLRGTVPIRGDVQLSRHLTTGGLAESGLSFHARAHSQVPLHAHDDSFHIHPRSKSIGRHPSPVRGAFHTRGGSELLGAAAVTSDVSSSRAVSPVSERQRRRRFYEIMTRITPWRPQAPAASVSVASTSPGAAPRRSMSSISGRRVKGKRSVVPSAAPRRSADFLGAHQLQPSRALQEVLESRRVSSWVDVYTVDSMGDDGDDLDDFLNADPATYGRFYDTDSEGDAPSFASSADFAPQRLSEDARDDDGRSSSHRDDDDDDRSYSRSSTHDDGSSDEDDGLVITVTPRKQKGQHLLAVES